MVSAKRAWEGAIGRVTWLSTSAHRTWPSLAIAVTPVVGLLGAALARRWMDEDGFINLRIVRNVLLGFGPVFNLDERVEAATSPLWIAVLTLLGLLRIRLEPAAVYGGIALTCAGLLLAQDAAWFLRAPGCPPLRRRWLEPALPVGAAIFAVLPAAWDYASSGLETGLALAWLGASYRCLTERAAGRSEPGAWPWQAALLGLGPLVRPELALYSALFLVCFGWALLADLGNGGTRGALLGRLASAGALAAAAPVAYQLFRMGYYASVTPNTAIAKEAFLANWNQGRCYFDNFFGTYLLGWPLIPAGVFWVTRIRDDAAARRGLAIACAVAPVVAGSLHVLYLVAMGGDYMHARLLLPPLFAALMPVMTIPVGTPRLTPDGLVCGRSAADALPLALAGLAIASWLVVCGFTLRVSVENRCSVGDERGWYARQAAVANPVDVVDYRKHFFFESAQKWLKRVRADCGSTDRSHFGDPRCRQVYVEEEKPLVSPEPGASPLVEGVAPDVLGVVAVGAIGIVGFVLPSRLQVVDYNGLSDAIVGRFELQSRGRPGHEKTLPMAWLMGRFAAPQEGEDAAVTAARHALHCGALGVLERDVRGPLTLAGFARNLGDAWANARLRIPRDPFEAEERFCGTPHRPEVQIGGGGGSLYRWLCPPGHPLSGLRASYKAKDKAIARVQALCGSRGEGEEIAGPWFGESADTSLEVSCPPGTVVSGLYGTADDMVHTVGATCLASGGARLRTTSGGVAGGRVFQKACGGNAPAVGIVGRSGSLVDALGLVCEQ
jgi:arabinofuranosyltransferase